jgi:hypothetical protein
MIGLVTGVLLSMLGVILYMPWTKEVNTEVKVPDPTEEISSLGNVSLH